MPDDDTPSSGLVTVDDILAAVDVENVGSVDDVSIGVTTLSSGLPDIDDQLAYTVHGAWQLRPQTPEERHDELSSLLSMISTKSTGARLPHGLRNLPVAGLHVSVDGHQATLEHLDHSASTNDVVDELAKLAIEVARSLTPLAHDQTNPAVKQLIHQLKRKLVAEINAAMVSDVHDGVEQVS